MKILVRVLLPLIVIAAGYGVMKWLSSNEEEETARRGPPQRRLPEVDVIELRRSEFPVTIASQGVTRAHNSTSLTPRVSGRILKVHKSFEDGAFFKEGEVLVELDAADFHAALAVAEARLARADAALAQELARAEQAILDWQDLRLTDEDPSDLVLRKPQRKEAEADVKASQAELVQATRNLERSQVVAPYDGCVRERLVGPGQSVSPNTPLGEIFSTDFAEVRLPLAAEDLPFLELPDESDPEPLPVVLTDSLGPESPHQWTGEIVRTEGILDEASRELFVIARVEDPYGLTTGQPPLRVGQPVAARLTGRVLENVFTLPRSSLRNPTEVVVVNPEDSTIERRTIEAVWTGRSQVVVRDGLPEGWWLVTSPLALAANGAKVEVMRIDGAPRAALNPEDGNPATPPSKRPGLRPAG